MENDPIIDELTEFTQDWSIVQLPSYEDVEDDNSWMVEMFDDFVNVLTNTQVGIAMLEDELEELKEMMKMFRMS